MNPGLVVKLRPAGPWRIGPDSGARNRVDAIYHSDSLYSAITSAMARLGLLDQWLDSTARSAASAVCFSSCYPFQDDVVFVVPPRTIWPPTTPALLSSPVRWKSARFVPIGIVASILAGKRLDDRQWTLDGASECLVPAGKTGPFRTGVRWSAAVDRLTGATERHSTACMEFRPGAGLWTVAGFADEAAHTRWLDPVKAAFRLLADTGFGGERSRGWGRSESPEFIEGSLPDMVLPPVERPAVAAVRAASPVLPVSAPEKKPEPEKIPETTERPVAPPAKTPEAAQETHGAEAAPETPAAEAAEPGAAAPEAPVAEAPPETPAAEAAESASAAPEPAGEAVEPVAAAPETPAAEAPPETPAAEAAESASAAPEPAGEAVEPVAAATETHATEAAPETPAAEAAESASAAPEPAGEAVEPVAAATETHATEAAPETPAAEAAESASAAPEPAGEAVEPVAAATETPAAEAAPETPAEHAVEPASAAPETPAAEAAPETPAEHAVEPASAAPETPAAEAAPEHAAEAAEPASAATETHATEAAPETPAEGAAESAPTAPETPAAEAAPETPTAEAAKPVAAAQKTPGAEAALEKPAPTPALKTHPHWLLSLFAPAAADTVDWARGNYTVLARAGRVDSPAGSGELKKQLQMISEGSVVYAAEAPCGAAPDVAPDGFAHPVFRAGFALSIRLPEVS